MKLTFVCLLAASTVVSLSLPILAESKEPPTTSGTPEAITMPNIPTSVPHMPTFTINPTRTLTPDIDK